LLTFLMNFLDSGQLADGKGDTVDARRAVILMTTNCGREAINEAAACAVPGAEPGAEADAELLQRIRLEVLRDICDGRWENLGRLGTIVPFGSLSAEGRLGIVRRQLKQVNERLHASYGKAAELRWSEELEELVAARWDDDIGGRSTRDFIEEAVVEAVADVLDGSAALSERAAADSTAATGGAAAERSQPALQIDLTTSDANIVGSVSVGQS